MAWHERRSYSHSRSEQMALDQHDKPTYGGKPAFRTSFGGQPETGHQRSHDDWGHHVCFQDYGTVHSHFIRNKASSISGDRKQICLLKKIPKVTSRLKRLWMLLWGFVVFNQHLMSFYFWVNVSYNWQTESNPFLYQIRTAIDNAIWDEYSPCHQMLDNPF